MNKRIRVNGVLYEAVNPMTRRSNRTLNESNIRVLTKSDMIGTSMASLPYGPCYKYDNGRYTAILSGVDDSPDTPIIYVEPNDYDELAGDCLISTHGQDMPMYDDSKDGYKEAKKDFQSICRMLDNGKDLHDIRSKFGYMII